MKRSSIALVLFLSMFCICGTSFGYVVYSEKFEASDGGYTHTGNNDCWQWGTPTAWPFSAASGSKCWGTNLAGNYSDYASLYLFSDWIDLSSYPAGTPVTLKWKQAYSIEHTVDNGMCNFLISPDQYEWSENYTGLNNDWTELSADISSAAGKQFRLEWVLFTDGSITHPGLFIDDVIVEIPIPSATDPDPEDGSTGIPCGDLVLSWVCESSDSFDLYFGPSSNELSLLSEDVTVTSYDLPLPLEKGKTYYWRVDVASGDIVLPGNLWSFTTLLDKAVSPDPANGSEDTANTDVVLSWEHLSDKVSFDVYFGLTSDDMEAVATGLSENSIALVDDLDFSTGYFWRVDAKTEDTAESGDLWSFTTADEKISGNGGCNLGTFSPSLGLLILPLLMLLRK